MRELSIDEIVALSASERAKYLDQLKASLPTWEDILAKSQQIRETQPLDADQSLKELSLLADEMNRAWETYYASK